MSEGTFNPAKRRLCPDGACIGVIGDDGRCRECGRTAGGGAATAAIAAGAGRAGASHEDHDHDDDLGLDGGGEPSRMAAGDLAGGAGAGDAGGGGFRPDRRLCDDGDCIGVVRDDGACSVCGRRAGG